MQLRQCEAEQWSLHEPGGEYSQQCTVYLQADPLMLNSGFVSVRRSQWVLDAFLPTWQSYTNDGRFQFKYKKSANFHAPEQAGLVAAVLHFAMRSLRPDHPLVVANRSQHICTDPKLSAQYVKEAAAYFAKHRQEPTKAFNFVGFETYYNYMRGTSRQTNRLYVCASYIYQAVLGLNQTQSATIPIDNQNAICLLGYHGRQINRHHMIPTWLQDIANGSIVTKGTFGNGFSKDLLLVHQKGLPAHICAKTWQPPRINTGRQEKWMTDVRTITFTRACMKARIETSLQAPRAPV